MTVRVTNRQGLSCRDRLSKKRKISLRGRRLYCILDLDLPYLRKKQLSAAKQLIQGGAEIIQLRSKLHPAEYLIALGLQIRQLTEKEKIILIVNDRPDIAEAICADGVHLGQEDLSPAIARRILGKDKLIGFSTHSLAQAKTAQFYDIDYISVGPVFSSPTKPMLKTVGIAALKEILQMSDLPVVAIGGINVHNLKTVLDKRINSFAMISSILRDKDIKLKTEEFKKKIDVFYSIGENPLPAHEKFD